MGSWDLILYVDVNYLMIILSKCYLSTSYFLDRLSFWFVKTMENATCVFIEEGANETVIADDTVVVEEALATIKEEEMEDATAVEVVRIHEISIYIIWILRSEEWDLSSPNNLKLIKRKTLSTKNLYVFLDELSSTRNTTSNRKLLYNVQFQKILQFQPIKYFPTNCWIVNYPEKMSVSWREGKEVIL